MNSLFESQFFNSQSLFDNLLNNRRIFDLMLSKMDDESGGEFARRETSYSSKIVNGVKTVESRTEYEDSDGKLQTVVYKDLGDGRSARYIYDNEKDSPDNLELRGVSSKDEFEKAWTTRKSKKSVKKIQDGPKFKVGDRVKIFLPISSGFDNNNIKQYEWVDGRVLKCSVFKAKNCEPHYLYDVVTNNDHLRRWNISESKLKFVGPEFDLTKITSSSPKVVNNSKISIKIESDQTKELERLLSKRDELNKRIQELSE